MPRQAPRVYPGGRAYPGCGVSPISADHRFGAVPLAGLAEPTGMDVGECGVPNTAQYSPVWRLALSSPLLGVCVSNGPNPTGLTPRRGPNPLSSLQQQLPEDQN
jgi:hypothetical protein